MTETASAAQVKKAISNRLDALKRQAELQNDYMLKMHSEEIETLFEMWERSLNVVSSSSSTNGDSA